MGEGQARADHEPGIDGLRAVAVGAVLLFHSGYTWARGGFLGVSVFFTLSGFLITGLLLDEIGRTDRIRLRSFWARRARRLVPASAVCLLFVALLVPFFAAAARPAQVRADILSALAHVANWRFVAAHQSYADLFVGGPSPVLHFWSLAVEEQFYIVVPCAMAFAAWGTRRLRLRWLPTATLVVLTGLSLVCVLATRSQDLAYYGTQTRAAEFLVGGLFAVWRRRSTDRLSTRAPGWLPATVGLIALSATAWLVRSVRQTDPWLYHGGFALLSVLWCLLILGALSSGLMRTALCRWPLVRIGQLSYGIYLFHWPVFQLITAARVGVGGPMLLSIRLFTTVELARFSSRLVERPLRERRWRLQGGRAAAAIVTSMLLIVGVTALRSQHSVGAAVSSMVTAPDHVVELGAHSSTPAPVVAPPTTDVVVVGSGDVDLGAVRRVVASAGPGVRLVDLTEPGCGAFLAEDEQRGCTSVSGLLRYYLANAPRPAAVVLAVGGTDHAAAAARISKAATRGTTALIEQYTVVETDARVVDDLRTTIGDGVQLLVLDQPSDASTALSNQLLIATVRTQDSAMTTPTEVGHILRSAIDRRRLALVEPARLRVMVIGDSTSYGVALGLDRLASDKLQVVWAGRRNCPIAAAVEIRWWPGAQFTMQDCLASQRQWPTIAAQLRPDVVLVVESLPEHSEQRYEGDPNWYAAGDPRFTQVHEIAMQQLIDMIAPYHATVMLSDSPHGGSSQRARVDAWNVLVARWAVRWPTVGVLPLAGFLDATEAAAGHSLRPDGIHMNDATEAKAISEVYLPPLIHRYSERVGGSANSASSP